MQRHKQSGFHSISVGLYGRIFNWTLPTKTTTFADQKREKRKRYIGQSNLPNGCMNTTVGTNMHFREKKSQENKSIFLY